MEIIELAIAILATYRLANLLPEDNGPFFIFKRIRLYANAKMINEDKDLGIWTNIDDGITCPHCMGLYAAIFCGLLISWHNFYGNLFLLIMAIAGGQSLLQKLGEKNG